MRMRQLKGRIGILDFFSGANLERSELSKIVLNQFSR